MVKNKKIVIQPYEIFKLLGIKTKDRDLALKVMSTTLDFLLYMNTNDVLELSGCNYIKISEDLIYLDSKLSKKKIIDELSNRKIIKLPL